MARILIIDDDVLLCELLMDHLIRAGFEVTTATRAEKGLKIALTTKPDLIILDVVLPDLTGYQVCGKLRQSEQTQSIPILMVTGFATFPNQEGIGRLMGANDYLLKPFTMEEIVTRTHRLLGSAVVHESTLV